MRWLMEFVLHGRANIEPLLTHTFRLTTLLTRMRYLASAVMAY
jgi:hypothetical protein